MKRPPARYSRHNLELVAGRQARGPSHRSPYPSGGGWRRAAPTTRGWLDPLGRRQRQGIQGLPTGPAWAARRGICRSRYRAAGRNPGNWRTPRGQFRRRPPRPAWPETAARLPDARLQRGSRAPEVGPDPPGELIQREFRGFRHPAGILPDGWGPLLRNKSTLRLLLHLESGPCRKPASKIARE